ncbi:type II toxin-antitoxin system VapC family toxin [Candidatus Sumerlaeota bacterium]|nr:type II toxin-antitoxin system VapC family toxin [Candidatus Sumerlaeota bacterium]
MNVVDSCGWIEYFWDKPGADFFTSPIQDTPNLIVPVICLYEVYKYMLTYTGKESAVEAIAIMHQGTVIEMDERIAIQAAIFSHDMKLPMADSIILATSRIYKATLYTQDKDFENIPGIKYQKKI